VKHEFFLEFIPHHSLGCCCLAIWLPLPPVSSLFFALCPRFSLLFFSDTFAPSYTESTRVSRPLGPVFRLSGSRLTGTTRRYSCPVFAWTIPYRLAAKSLLFPVFHAFFLSRWLIAVPVAGGVSPYEGIFPQWRTASLAIRWLPVLSLPESNGRL